MSVFAVTELCRGVVIGAWYIMKWGMFIFIVLAICPFTVLSHAVMFYNFAQPSIFQPHRICIASYTLVHFWLLYTNTPPQKAHHCAGQTNGVLALQPYPACKRQGRDRGSWFFMLVCINHAWSTHYYTTAARSPKMYCFLLALVPLLPATYY